MVPAGRAERQQGILLALVPGGDALGPAQRFLGPALLRRDRLGFPRGKVFVNVLHRPPRLNVAGNDDGHVARHVMFLVILIHVFERRVFQVFDFADGGLLAVRMFFEEQFVDRELDDRLLVVEHPIFLLINDLQFGLEQPENRMSEPFGLNDRPLFGPVCGQVDLINRFLVVGVRVKPLFAHGLVKFVHLVGNLILRGGL